MIKTIVLIGHGRFASGMKSACELIAGPKENLIAIDFGLEEETLSLNESIQRVLDLYDQQTLIFMCDLMGGTPFKTAVEMTQDRADTVVLAGVNVSGLLEVVLQSERLSLEQVCAVAIQQTQCSVLAFEKKVLYCTAQFNNGI